MDSLIEVSNLDDQAVFAHKFGSIFEYSPWIAEEAWSYRPFGSREELLDRMSDIVMNADEEKQLTLLRAHSELETKANVMKAGAAIEHRDAGLDSLDRLDRDETYILGQLNEKYKERFGFPFIIAARGLASDMIADSLQQRMKNSDEEERQRALQEVIKIAAFRLTHLELQASSIG